MLPHGEVVATLALIASNGKLIVRLEGVIPSRLIHPLLLKMGQVEDVLLDVSVPLDAAEASRGLSDAPVAEVDFPPRLSQC